MTEPDSPLHQVARGFAAAGHHDQAALTLLFTAWNALDQGYHRSAARELRDVVQTAEPAAKRGNQGANLALGLAAWTGATIPADRLPLSPDGTDTPSERPRVRLDRARVLLDRARSPLAIDAKAKGDTALNLGRLPPRPRPRLGDLPNFSSTAPRPGPGRRRA